MAEKGILPELKRLFAATDKFENLRSELSQKYASQAEGVKPEMISVCGLAGGATAYFTALLNESLAKNLLFVTADFDEGQNLADDLANIVGENKVCFYPPRGVYPMEFRTPSGDLLGQRLDALARMLAPQRQIIVAPAAALLEPTMARADFENYSLHLEVGQEMEIALLTERLTNLGFNRVQTVEEIGDFAVRGGLIDFFSPSHEMPIRAEFFDDEIDSLRYFEVRDQRTVERLKMLDLLPRREIPLQYSNLEQYLDKLAPKDADLVRARFLSEPDLPGLEWLAQPFNIRQGQLLDFLNPDDLVVLSGGAALREEMREFHNGAVERSRRSSERFAQPIEPDKYFFDPDRQFELLQNYVGIDIHPFRSRTNERFDFACSEHPAIGSRLDYLKETIDKFHRQEFLTVITCDNTGQAQRLGEILAERGINVPVEVFHIHAGFVSETMRVALLTDHQIFSRQFRRIKRRRYKEGVALASYSNLNRGDVVVHADYGLARFEKLETISVDGRSRDCLQLIYRDGDKLYVPIEEFNRVSKYAGKDASPKLTSLGGTSWDKIKRRTKKAIEDMAADLLKLYAERKLRPGHKFGADTVWQRQLEASFPYEETPDQFKAINAVKQDMESENPSDRLVCGDVGYGKTEVAVRAAFKAVEEGKQVAVLVPTTILAQQHFATFHQRMKDFPLKIEMLSRFKTRKEQKEIVKELAEGKVDIIIGTHRLLSKDVFFADLGLLVVDEEQRFGVRHKEKLRQLKKNVDTITLTATPIPRTLQLSLMGARDMSLINTSPRDRLPITTEICEFDPQVIAEAVLREIDREGQVFFVHNRVQTIEAIYRYLKKWLPQVEIGIAHGQMHERELEGVMLAFLARRYQVLLCTSIIESGLDIPSVNTIIINRADRFGLAQLYQLRGRVGRSSVRAYAYLMTPKYKLLTEDARKRLRAIEAHSDLGSGFALAMRDLEIRGAGDILGARQSGFIEEIGFDLYTKLLEETIAELKGEKLERLPDTKLDGNLDLYLPDDYISIKQHKVDIYRRLADARRLNDIEKLRDEVADRFGRLPEKAEIFFDAAALRLVAAISGAERVRVGKSRISVEYPAATAFNRGDIEVIRRVIDAPVEFSMLGGMKFTVDVGGIKADDRLKYMKKALDQIASGMISSKVTV